MSADNFLLLRNFKGHEGPGFIVTHEVLSADYHSDASRAYERILARTEPHWCERFFTDYEEAVDFIDALYDEDPDGGIFFEYGWEDATKPL